MINTTTTITTSAHHEQYLQQQWHPHLPPPFWYNTTNVGTNIIIMIIIIMMMMMMMMMKPVMIMMISFLSVVIPVPLDKREFIYCSIQYCYSWYTYIQISTSFNDFSYDYNTSTSCEIIATTPCMYEQDSSTTQQQHLDYCLLYLQNPSATYLKKNLNLFGDNHT